MDDEPPPFWLQTTTTLHHVNHHRHRHRHVSSFFLNTGVLITFLLITAIMFLVILIPYLVSHAKQLFNPHLVKSSWNSLNIVLVLFAILCGFLSRKDDDQTTTPSTTPTSSRKDLFKRPDLNNPSQWYTYNENINVPRLRSSSSYPDLRQDNSGWLVKENRWRFHDDTDVESYQFRRSDSLTIASPLRSFRRIDDNDDLDRVQVEVEINDIEVDTSIRHETESKRPAESTDSSPLITDVISGEIESETKNQEKDVEMQETYIPSPSPSPAMSSIYPPPSPTAYYWPSPSPPPPPPPPPQRRRKAQTPVPKKETNQTFETIGYGRYKLHNSSSVPASQPPPQPPVPSQSSPPRSRNESGGRKRGGVNVTKDFFTSFYNQSKRKRKPNNKRRSYENLETFIDDQQSSQNVSIHRSKSNPEFPQPSPQPPPPPPPPPQSVLQTLFSKKPKKRHPVRKPDNANITIPAPPPPPPPPPPPFKMKPWKFTIQGDYVRLESINNSPRSGYSASEDESISPTSTKNSPTQTRINTNNSPTQTSFCPSPDVNMKAEDFIAKLRAKWTLEKSDSINMKQGGTGPSRLRPDLS